ncbi:MAG: HsdR family type I site-specific deoxyribonuclease, partial [Actinobacteria bacterium]|nr:HsdR family type I site-specific deoxyribonuclease [Actinomycetota bacterium]
TVFFIVDRNELETQLNDEFNYLDIVEPEKINSVFELKRVLKHDDYRGKRGIFITLIHKFRPEELADLQNEIEEISRFKETIANRENVIVFIDEGHRTQYGLLAAQMKKIFKSAFFFAFTGTPISKTGKDTYLEYAYPPEEIYLDKYFIADSIKDKYTVKIVYQPRLIEKVHLNKEMLEEFLKSELEEIPDTEEYPFGFNYRGKIEEKIKDKLNLINSFLENPERINLIAKDVAEHFKRNIDRKFKALIVAASRKACLTYKNLINKYLPEEYSEIVMTHTVDDSEPLLERVAEIQSRFGTKKVEDINKQNISAFKEKTNPKILIVTDMLLTGFDAPQLKVLYLDKPLKEHRLLQAIARTNRPYKEIKEGGIVIDYVGVLSNIKRALEIYNEEDIEFALFDYGRIRKQFQDLIKEIFDIFSAVPRNYDRQTLLKTFEILTTDSIREKDFVEKYKNLRKLFELLGSDEIKVELLEDYKWINAVFIYYDKMVNKQLLLDDLVKKYFAKTLKFIHQSTQLKEIQNLLPEIAFDENYLGKLQDRVKDVREKAANILFTLNKFILVEQVGNPIYESLVQKVERLLELWKEKTKDYERIYTEGVKIIKLVQDVSKRQKSLNLS